MRPTTILVLVCAAASCVAPRVAAQVPDPRFTAFVKQCEERVAKHAFFKRITLLPTWTQSPPFVFFLERPLRDKPDYGRKIVYSHLPFLTKLAEIFEKEYATRLGLSRGKDTAGFAIAVLASRGSYSNFAQAVRVSALHQSRAHYDTRLRLAVTYVDAFSPYDSAPEERRAILHEFVHALQHAYSATGEMPNRVWFNEGLAEFRSVSTNIASSLENPLLDQGHLMTLISVLTNPKWRPLVSPLSDLVTVDSYADLLRRAQQRLGAPPDVRLALQVFYAQSAAFVAFLHSAQDGKHRQAFQDYAGAVMRGRTDAGAMLPSLEGLFRRHLAAEAERRLGIRLGAGLREHGRAAAVLPPPIDYDPSKLGWRREELGVRLAAARAQCARGKYEAAAELLHGVEDGSADAAPCKREAERVAAILRLRDELFRVALGRKTRFWVKVDGKRVRGEFTGREGDSFILKNKGVEQRLPLTALSPDNLAFECKKVGLVDRSSWETAWLSWLGGSSAERALRNVETTAAGRALQGDLRGTFEARGAEAAVALADIQDLKPGKDAREASRQLARIREAILVNRKSPLFASREGPLRLCVRALAQRAFSLSDPQCLDIAGKAVRGADGTMTVTYTGSGEALSKDFALEKNMEWAKDLLSGYGKLATARTYLRRKGKYSELGGSGVFLWPLELVGPQVIEVCAELTGPGFYEVILCGDEGGFVTSSIGGSVCIYDVGTEIRDSLGDSRRLYIEKVHKLRIEHNGKSRITVSVDGKQTAQLTSVGSRVRGSFGFLVHSSRPLRIHSLKVQGKITVPNALEMRRAFVSRVLRELWP